MGKSSESILGHTLQLASLTEDLAKGNVAHAYLFAGPRGVGKFTVAKWFATTLLTQGMEEEAADRARQQIKRMMYSDLSVIDKLWIEDVQEDLEILGRSSTISQDHRKKAKAKTDSIGIEDIRVLQERLHETASGTYKCCLIRRVERMHDEAVNSLLKILEEPPQGVVFVLTTESLALLLPTLISRARLLRFTRVADREVLPLLSGLDDQDQRFILRVAQGAPGIARTLADDPEALRKERTIAGNAASFWRSTSLMERLKILTPLHEKGEDADRLLLHLALALREELAAGSHEQADALLEMLRGFQTNVSRQLLAQRFALALS